ncbi:MFS transporter [Streptomyces anulatus]|uniref:MFS transporter n=1 Tax=Streptomyces anulatus TaxID=1892 RepID=UPI00053B4ACC|nr:MFS transporter [Streptomyces anulatus]
MTVVEQAGTPARGGAARRAKTVLISVIGLHLVAETALTPFLPQLFERLYGIEDPEATGLYIWICRIVGLAALPLWGLAARRWPLHKLVLAGLCGSAVLDLLLGLAPSYAAYTVLSTLIVMTNSALLLAYPAFIAEHGDESEGGERARLAGVCTLVVVFHLSVVVSTMVGAGVLALPEPRIGISAFAVLDTLLAVLTYRILGRRPDVKAAESAESAESAADGSTAGDGQDTDGASGTAPDSPGPVVRGPSSRLTWFTMLAYAALIGVAFDFSVNVARPFFTEFADSLGSGSVGSAVLFFLPSVSALAVLPLVRRCHDRFGDRLLPLALAVGAAGMAWSWLADSLPGLVGGRLLYGVGLGLAQVAVELRMFRATGTKGPAFTAVETVRSAGLLAAPLAATAAVSHDLALPLAVAAAVQVCAVALSVRRFRNAAPQAGARRAGRVSPDPDVPAVRRDDVPKPQADATTTSMPASVRSGAVDSTPSLMATASPAYSEENHR